MTVTSLEHELMVHIHTLGYSQQQQVLAFIQTLTRRPLGSRGQDLVPFAGSIDRTALQAMQAAITDACEQVDPHEW